MESIYFLVNLATLIQPENYKEEFNLAKTLLAEFKERYPEINENDLKTFIIFSYQVHSEHLSYNQRREYMEITFLLSYYEELYGSYISDYSEELKMRKQFCRSQTNQKLSKHRKTAITEITYYLYIEQLNAERELLLNIPPTLIKQ